jgi:uncharacterized protein YgbK (DUF1537 family)
MSIAPASNLAADLTSWAFQPWLSAEQAAWRRQLIRQRMGAGAPVVVVLDDDPTGSQVVAGLPLLTAWDDDSLDWAFARGAAMIFIVTNTRALPAAWAADRVRQVVLGVDAAAARAGVDYVVTCRGDSTLRGHFPAETDAARATLADLGRPVDAVLLVPAYVEAGRVTIDGTHYVIQGADLVPVAQTDYARDATFGYTSSRLADYVAECSAGQVDPGQVVSLDLDQIRQGPDTVAQILSGVAGGTVVAVDAVLRADLDAVVAGLLQAEADGKRFVYRSGPSFVAARVGMELTEPIRPATSGAHGLVVVGSHVELTGRQVARLQQLAGIRTVELAVARLIDPAQRDQAIAAARHDILADLALGDVIALTSRQLVAGPDAAASLAIASQVSDAVVDIVRAVHDSYDLGWVIAKGGITSHDVATRGLGIRRAMVAGQLFPGQTSVWMTVATPGTGRPTAGPYVVFAGNVGSDDSLAEAVQILRGGHA